MWYSYEQKKYISEVDAQPVTISYFTNAGKGTITINPAEVFPCSVHDIKVIIDILWKSSDTYETAGNIAEYLRNCIQDAKTYRAQFPENHRNAAIITAVNSIIKKYVSNLDKIADAFGLEKETDTAINEMKMEKCEVLCLESENGKGIVKKYVGKQFVKNGFVFQVCQKQKKGSRFIIVPNTGRMLTYYKGTDKQAPAIIEEQTIKILKDSINNGKLYTLQKEFENICNETGVECPQILSCYISQEPETIEENPAPISETEMEQIIKDIDKKYNEFYECQPRAALYSSLVDYGTKVLTIQETIPGFTENQTRRFLRKLTKMRGDYFTSDRECAALASVILDYFKKKEQQTAKPETAKKRRTADRKTEINHIKRDSVRVMVRLKYATNAGEKGDILDAKKDKKNTWTAENKRTGEKFSIFVSTLRNYNAFELVTQQTETEMETAKNDYCVTISKQEKKKNHPPYYLGQQTAQVWKPCTMTKPAENGIIYGIIPAHIATAEQPAPELTQGKIKPFKMQGCINVYRTGKKPATGKIQALKRHKIHPETVRGSPRKIQDGSTAKF